MIGYHYTSCKLYKKIKRQGLIPYDLSKEELRAYFPDGVMGIWIWAKKLKGKAELGSILYQVATKQDVVIVKLRVEYTESSMLYYGDGRTVELYHSGNVGDWYYHNGKQMSHIVTEVIVPKNITLLAKYNLLDLVKK